MKTYFITGISGFLGRNIVLEILKREQAKIIGLVLPNEKNIDDLRSNKNISLIEGNILNYEDIKRFLSIDVDDEKIIIHAAGRISVYKKGDPLTTSINYEGTKNVVEAALETGCDKFIYISSVDALNKRKGEDVIYEQDFYDISQVDGVYSKSKVLASNYVKNAYLERKLPAIILHPSVFIGPNDPFNSPINFAIKQFLNGKLPILVKGKYNIADVRDIAKGIVDAANRGLVGESYILSGSQIMMIDLINKVAKIENKKPIKIVLPIWLIKLVAPFIELAAKIRKKSPLFTAFSMDCLKQNSNFSSSKAEKDFNYTSRNLEDTLIDLVKWMKESNYLNK